MAQNVYLDDMMIQVNMLFIFYIHTEYHFSILLSVLYITHPVVTLIGWTNIDILSGYLHSTVSLQQNAYIIITNMRHTVHYDLFIHILSLCVLCCFHVISIKTQDHNKASLSNRKCTTTTWTFSGLICYIYFIRRRPEMSNPSCKYTYSKTNCMPHAHPFSGYELLLLSVQKKVLSVWMR